MPTHQDHPWERDARKRAERRQGGTAAPQRPLGHPGVVWGVLAVTALVVVLRLPARMEGADLPTAAAPVVPAAPVAVAPAPAGSVTDLRSRYVGTATLEIWGATDAADGASVELRISTPAGDHEHVVDAPSAGGHFFAAARIPRAMRGTRVSVEARVER